MKSRVGHIFKFLLIFALIGAFFVPVESGGKALGNGGSFFNGLRISNVNAPALRSVTERLLYRGSPNTILRGTEVNRGDGFRVFITDTGGKIIKEITSQRVKIRISNIAPDGSLFETFRKIGPPTAEDLKILDLFK